MTAEVAITLPVLLTMLVLGLWLTGTVVLNIQCTDAARDVARAVARGESLESAQELGRRTAPKNATITITRTPTDIHVKVTATPTDPGPLLAPFPTTHVTAEATLQSEPTTQAAPP
ncbi:TadE family type IV pilus minor pilin [Kribbella sp. NPDC002412]